MASLIHFDLVHVPANYVYKDPVIRSKLTKNTPPLYICSASIVFVQWIKQSLTCISLELKSFTVESIYALQSIVLTLMDANYVPTHCGLMTSFGDRNLGQLCFRKWLIAWRHQAYDRSNIDSSLARICSIRMRVILQREFKLLFCEMSLKWVEILLLKKNNGHISQAAMSSFCPIESDSSAKYFLVMSQKSVYDMFHVLVGHCQNSQVLYDNTKVHIGGICSEKFYTRCFYGCMQVKISDEALRN